MPPGTAVQLIKNDDIIVTGRASTAMQRQRHIRPNDTFSKPLW